MTTVTIYTALKHRKGKTASAAILINCSVREGFSRCIPVDASYEELERTLKGT